jgi:glycerol-3-phosphate dehydrogenase
MSSVDVVDVVIFGGGVAGLWLLNRLRNSGIDAILLEANALGTGQTIASQGMVHGGIKYALGGALTGASESIAAMPAHWRSCLRGEGDVDLRGASILSEAFYMWSPGGIGSRVTSFLASKVTRGRVDNLTRNEYPAPFNHPTFRGKVYRLVDMVLDVPSLLSTLCTNHRSHVFKIDAEDIGWHSEDGELKRINIRHAGSNIVIEPRHVVLAAGEGNEALMKAMRISTPAMQRRPLQQVIVKHNYPFPLYAHCIGTNASPRLTISSHPCKDGRWVWYLGGDLATDGTNDTPQVLIEKAKKELHELFGWLDFSSAQWRTIKLDRAEPLHKQLLKPDNAFAETSRNLRNVIVAWPTKLTLAPDMANRVMKLLPALSPTPRTHEALSVLPKPAVATAPWETLFAQDTATVTEKAFSEKERR